MSDRPTEQHLDLPELEAYVAGARPDLDAHVQACPRCRAEVRDLVRFLGMEDDAELNQEAGWTAAEARLERLGAPRPRARILRLPRWLPAAAALAAVLTLMLVNVPRDLTERGAMRGATTAAVTLATPSGDIPACPEQFTWTCDRPVAHYAMEIFTADLERVAGADSLTAGAWAPGAALCDSLTAGPRYLWTVTAHFEAAEPVASAPGWFTVRP